MPVERGRDTLVTLAVRGKERRDDQQQDQRAQRHVPDSITSLRLRLSGALGGKIGKSLCEDSQLDLAKSLLEKDERVVKRYQDKICQVDAKSMECAWIKKSADLKTSSSLALQVLQVNEYVKAKNWSLALEQIEPLLTEEILFSGLQKNYVKSYFSWLKSANTKSDRQPASVKNTKITEKFKKYYGVE